MQRSSFVLWSHLRPGPIPQIQETYLASPEARLIATVALVALTALAVACLHRVQPAVGDRYGSNAAEAVTVAGLVGVVFTSIYAFSVIWHVTYVLVLTLEAITIDRWDVAEYVVTAAVALIAYLAIRFVNRSIDKLSETGAITSHQSEVAYHVADVGIIVVAGSIVLTLWGVPFESIFISAGAITAIVALTARETLAAMLAGFVLLFSRPFRVGDWVAISVSSGEQEQSGVVTDVTIFNTKIRTARDEHIMIPNDEVTSSHLTNYSRNNRLRIEIEVGVDYETDLERARTVMVDAVSDLDLIEPAPSPRAVATGFGDSAILLELHVWIADPTRQRQLGAQTAAIQAVTRAFDREGIEIPYPQRVHAARGEDGFRVNGPGPEDRAAPSTDD